MCTRRRNFRGRGFVLGGGIFLGEGAFVLGGFRGKDLY